MHDTPTFVESPDPLSPHSLGHAVPWSSVHRGGGTLGLQPHLGSGYRQDGQEDPRVSSSRRGMFSLSLDHPVSCPGDPGSARPLRKSELAPAPTAWAGRAVHTGHTPQATLHCGIRGNLHKGITRVSHTHSWPHYCTYMSDKVKESSFIYLYSYYFHSPARHLSITQ